jgi:hypothetical protein
MSWACVLRDIRLNCGKVHIACNCFTDYFYCCYFFLWKEIIGYGYRFFLHKMSDIGLTKIISKSWPDFNCSRMNNIIICEFPNALLIKDFHKITRAGKRRTVAGRCNYWETDNQRPLWSIGVLCCNNLTQHQNASVIFRDVMHLQSLSIQNFACLAPWVINYRYQTES